MGCYLPELNVLRLPGEGGRGGGGGGLWPK